MCARRVRGHVELGKSRFYNGSEREEKFETRMVCGVPKDGIEIDVKRTVGLDSEQCSPRSVWSSPGFGLDWTAMNCIHILWVEGCRNAKKKRKKKTGTAGHRNCRLDWTTQSVDYSLQSWTDRGEHCDWRNALRSTKLGSPSSSVMSFAIMRRSSLGSSRSGIALFTFHLSMWREVRVHVD
jgi:hypothetical protein